MKLRIFDRLLIMIIDIIDIIYYSIYYDISASSDGDLSSCSESSGLENADGGTYSGVLITLLFGTGFSSVTGIGTGASILTGSFPALAFFILAPIFLIDLVQYLNFY